MPETGTILNLVLMGLLLVALWFGMRLDKRLKALRSSHEDFAKAVHELDDAAIRAHNSLKGLRADADESQDLLHGRILAARELQQKLETQMARAEKLTAELEASHSQNRDLASRLEALENAQKMTPMAAVTAPPVQRPNASRPSIDRQAFDRDVIRDVQPSPMRQPAPRSRPADIIKDDLNEEELVDKVHISELVVANLNEMIRNLALPKSAVDTPKRSVEDELFDAPKSRKS